jgi:hypothetical protein
MAFRTEDFNSNKQDAVILTAFFIAGTKFSFLLFQILVCFVQSARL